MERAVAVKKLRKMLGKHFGYQINKNAPNKEERAAARAESTEACKIRDEIGKRMKARSDAILAADAEYQTIREEYGAARKRCDHLFGTTHHYKITVGTSNSMFFHVHASGDSWEDIFAELAKKK